MNDDHDSNCKSQNQLNREPHILSRTDNGQLPGFVIEIGVDVFLDQFRNDINIGFQLMHPKIITVGRFDLLNTAAQVLAKVQNACCRAVAFAAARIFQKFRREILRSLNFVPGQLVVAPGDKVVHLQINFVLEVLIKAGGCRDVAADLRERQTREKKDQHNEQRQKGERYSQLQDQSPESGTDGGFIEMLPGFSHAHCPLRDTLSVYNPVSS